MNKRIITSILDNDLYKLTMQQAVTQLYPEAYARYQFINRSSTQFPDGFAEKLREEVEKMANLRLTKEEKDFLHKKCPYLTSDYLDYLESFRFNPEEVKINETRGNLEIFVEGRWQSTILWEVPLMALISELYFRESGIDKNAFPKEKRREVNLAKAALFQKEGVTFADFGTRRRFSFENHKEVVADMTKAGVYLKGTSNLLLAKEFDLTPIGTQAHEWFQFHAAKYGFTKANEKALQEWVTVYGKDLAIALSDTYGSGVFFRSFDKKRADHFAGIRQDSGDPFVFFQKVLDHYQKLGIDPAKKVIVFSDSLTPELAVKLHKEINGRVLDSYGIGTNLTNDVGVKPLNIVVKMVAAKTEEKADWTPTVKLSDVPGKHTGEQTTIERCKKELGLA